MTDIRVQPEGNIYLFHPITAAGVRFVNHVLDNAEEAQTFGRALVVDQHYVLEMVDMARDAGLNLEAR